MSVRPTRFGVTGVAVASVIATLAACSSSSGGTKAGGGATSTAANARIATVSVTAAKGCTPDKRAFPAGALTFKVANKDATAVSEVELLSGERIIGEKENLPPGFTGEFAVTVTAGTYTLYCPEPPPSARV